MQLCLEGQWVLVMDYETGVNLFNQFSLKTSTPSITN